MYLQSRLWGRGAAVAIAMALVLPVSASAYVRPGHTILISKAVAARQSDTYFPAISGDGSTVAFSSPSAGFVESDTNQTDDVFVTNGAGLERVSVTSDGIQATGPSWRPALSADGSIVAFDSEATNLVPGDGTGGNDVFVRDRAAATTERISVSSEGVEANGWSMNADISTDGSLVAFDSVASNLVPGDANGVYDVFVRDHLAGTTTRVSISTEGAEGNGNSLEPALSPDGRYVAFQSLASNLVPGDVNLAGDVFLHDRETGVTERVSISTAGVESNGDCRFADVSAHGQVVAFQCEGSNLVPNDLNRSQDVFIRDRVAGVTQRVSVSSAGVEGDDFSQLPSISADGRYVAFDGPVSTMVPGDGVMVDVFVHDRHTSATTRGSVALDGGEPDGWSYFPVLDAEGRRVAFISGASDLIPGDVPDFYDIFVHDLGPGVGIGGVSTSLQGDELLIEGWATFSGAPIASASDPAGDVGAPESALGGDLLGGKLIYRPEEEDFAVRLSVASLPGARPAVPGGKNLVSASGAPMIMHGVSFRVGEKRYEARAFRLGATAVPPGAPVFALYECAAECAEIRRLEGGIGTVGDEVSFSIPLAAVGASAGGKITNVNAFSAMAEAAAWVRPIDDLAIPDAELPPAGVELVLREAGKHVWSANVQPEMGRFAATVGPVVGSGGDLEVEATACLGTECGRTRAPVAP